MPSERSSGLVIINQLDAKMTGPTTDGNLRFCLREPTKRFICRPTRFVFGPDGRVPICLFNFSKDVGVIDFTMVWRAAIWNRRKLDMPDEGPQIMQAVREITFHKLDMIAVEHQAHVGGVDGVDDSSRLLGGGQEIPRRIIAIERFNLSDVSAYGSK